jgi:hypothetical protein
MGSIPQVLRLERAPWQPSMPMWVEGLELKRDILHLKGAANCAAPFEVIKDFYVSERETLHGTSVCSICDPCESQLLNGRLSVTP